MEVLLDILYLCAIFFVPLLPAYFIYKYLPKGKTTVSGTSDGLLSKLFKVLGGLNIKLTGAFAGYFLLVLIAYCFVHVALTASKPSREVWQVTGTIQAKSTDPNASEEAGYVKRTKIGVIPDNLKVGSEGKFVMEIIVEPGHTESKRDFPALIFNLPRYVGPQLILDTADPNIAFTEKTRLINLTQPVVLEQLPVKGKVEEPKWD